jgi:uncharacterized protein YggU (UPF0235/DUF167 family)
MDDEVPVARIRLRVAPGSRRTELAGLHGDGWKVRVAAAPERGRANDAVCDLLASIAGVPRGSVNVVVGPASRDKVVDVGGVFWPLGGVMLAATAGM